jgi:TRAP-type C4-dicarboxylate transport system permease small subunit
MDEIENSIEKLQHKIEVQQKIYKIIIVLTIIIISFIMLYIGTQLFDVLYAEKIQ